MIGELHLIEDCGIGEVRNCEIGKELRLGWISSCRRRTELKNKNIEETLRVQKNICSIDNRSDVVVIVRLCGGWRRAHQPGQRERGGRISVQDHGVRQLQAVKQSDG